VDTAAPVITTTRLVLRDLREDDAEKIVEYFSEPEAQPYILTPQRSGNGMAAFVKSFAEQARESPWSARSNFAWAIVLRDTYELIGTCNLYDATTDSYWASVGWHLSGKFAGRGYATEAGREVVRFAFEERGVARVLADCFESNFANRRVFSKLGMRPSPGLALKKWWLALTYGEPKPVVRYVITKKLFARTALVA
jgi:[ribosomal protein S5]-alanine N-acetyltransferase